MKSIDVQQDNIRLSGVASKAGPLLAIIGLVFLGLSALLGSGGSEIAGGDVFWKSYLFAWISVLGICLGALFFVLLQHLTRSGWSVSVRRIAEGIAKNLSWMWMLFVPILLLILSGNGSMLYDWANPEYMADSHMPQSKVSFLSPSFWSIRALFFLLVWAILSSLYFRWSTKQDHDGDVQWTHKMQKWAPLCMILYAFTQSYAIIDWVMSLQPKWFSTMFAVYFFAACTTAFFSFIILFARFLQGTGHLRQSISIEHYHDLGKWLFGLGVVFWAYIGFSQYMLIWYANIPVETGWYMTRQLGGWAPISILLLFGHFIIPFLLLVTRWTKRWRSTLPLIAGWLLLMFFVDMYWLVMPVVPEVAIEHATSYSQLAETITNQEIGYGWNIVNVTCLIGMVSLVFGGTLLNLRKCNLVATADPRLDEALHFENA